ncbi:MAG TPA: DUF4019 domain-containing protein [Thermoanaerobaculaceae bacterium]|nr:DUF4019 domain-containing protein [Thermoanaerobaculaceae bacterium]
MRALNRALTVVAVAVCAFATGPVWAQHEEQEAKAVEAAKAWLALVDSGKFGESWDAAAPYFRSVVARDKWDARLVNSRLPLGRVLQRTLAAKKYTADLEGAPKGEYVILVFNTKFDNMPKAVENVTPMLQRDGSWRVTGYNIKPPQ